MPTYTYECRACGQTKDVFHGIRARPRVKCDACGGACKRLLGVGSGIIFKGSGFYETDYKRAAKEGQKKSEGSESGASQSESSGGNGKASKTDSKKTKPGSESKSKD